MITQTPGFLEMLKSIFDFFLGSLLRIFHLFKLWISIHNQLGGIFGWLPDALYSILILIFTVVVIYKVLGWE